jgi:hypothetical protein
VASAFERQGGTPAFTQPACNAVPSLHSSLTRDNDWITLGEKFYPLLYRRLTKFVHACLG